MASEADLAYIAGFFDGDGHVGVAKNNPRPLHARSHPSFSYILQIKIVNQDRAVLEFCRQTLQTGWVTVHKEPGIYASGFKVTKTLYEFGANAKQALSILEQLFPFLRVKKERVRLAIEFQKQKTERREQRGLLPLRVEDVQLFESLATEIASLNSAKGPRGKVTAVT